MYLCPDLELGNPDNLDFNPIHRENALCYEVEDLNLEYLEKHES